jgi:mono/diheme cytochrome c family protein
MAAVPRVLRSPAAVAATVGAGAVFALAGCDVKEQDADLVAGKRLFVEKCGSCHVLNRAGTKGTAGPNLDDAFRRDITDGFNRDTVRGVVRYQILYPRLGSPMPAKLVTGDDADAVAAYVARVAARAGKDVGLLATAVKPAGSGRPAVARGGVLRIDADPTGQLAYVTKQAQAPPGRLTIRSRNASSVPHDIAIEGRAVSAKGPVVKDGGVSQFAVRLSAGTYTFFCTVEGHRAGGMFGRLVVRRR